MFVLIMRIPRISSFFKSKKQGAGWFAIVTAPRGFYLAKVKLGGVLPQVLRCEYHETGVVTAAELEKLRHEQKIEDYRFTTLLSPGEYQILPVEAPNVPEEEQKVAIRWKIKDNLNIHIDEATVDALLIPVSKYGSERMQSMYAIAAHNDTIKKRIALFEQAKIELEAIDIQEMSQRNIAALFERQDYALGMLVFNANGGLMTLTSGGELFLARRMEINSGQLQDANEELRCLYLDRVELEMQRSLDYFDRQYNHLELSRVLVCAPEGVVEFLAATIDAQVEKLDLSQVMDISAVPALADSDFAANALPALGAALRQESRAL